MPPHVLSLECFVKAKELLNENGMMIVNFNGFLTGDIGRPGRSVYNTLKAAGFTTELLPTPGEEKDRNSLFIAGKNEQDFTQVRSPLLFKGKPVSIDSLFLNVKTLSMQDAIIFTDNTPVLEKLNIEAGNAWRKSYNESYTTFFIKNGIPLFN